MARKNLIEDANLLYVSFIIIALIIFTIIIVEGTFGQGETNDFQTEKTLSGVKIEFLSCNSFEISLKVINNSLSPIKIDEIHFYLESKEMNPKLYMKSCIKEGESLIVKINRKKGELKIFYKDKLIYNHYFP